jgi:signal peptidase I
MTDETRAADGAVEDVDESGAGRPDRPRKPWLAGLMSLFLPGWGQVYNGQLRKGLIFSAIALSMLPPLALAVLATQSLAPMWLGVCASVLLLLVSVVDAARAAGRLRPFRPRRVNRAVFYVGYAVVFFTLHSISSEYTKSHWIRAFRVPSSSMRPSLLGGDYFMADMRAVARPNRGELAVLRNPQQPDQQFVKRVVAVAGDQVEIVDKAVRVNGRPLVEPYAIHEDPEVRPGDLDPRDNTAAEVPVRHVYVLGDNRDNSNDSRWWGPVPQDYLQGTPIEIYWSWDTELGRVRWERIGRRLGRGAAAP